MTQFLDPGDDREGSDDDSFDEDPLESDQDAGDAADDEADATACPFCGRPIHEDADVCPRCGNFIGAADAPRRPLTRFVWVGIILAALCVLTWLVIG